ncbi:OmpA family protein [Flavobacterium sp. H122]|uniref:OmpA family protein n=1 Tax=Flavobacterium sp. H122 TaxID=2529860 RepID=UPI0010A9B7D5|nr:OmpA family protein [Flavobacterium sp. H122]
MKNLVFSAIFLLISTNLFSQDNFINSDLPEEISETKKTIIELNDTFDVFSTGINSPLSDIGATFFMNKYIMYSSRKTGAIGAGKDANTNSPYNSLYCINIDNKGNLSHPYFFASVLNEEGNEAGISFSPDQKTVYYTNSKPGNSKNYQLYKASFDETCRCSNAWIKKELVTFSNTDYSIENPCVSADGKKIYFSSNMPGGFGGYDLYTADLDENGTPSNPKNLGKEINTAADEKFPYTSPDNDLFFSSNGHSGYGGQDVFVSRIRKKSFTQPINLGKTLNTAADEVAFILATKKMGFVTSNRNNSKGSYDIYKFGFEKQTNGLNGIAYEKNSKIALPNTLVSLIDADGNEIAKQFTTENGSFAFDVVPLESYTITAKKDGYLDFTLPVKSTVGNTQTDIALEQKKAEVTTTNILIEHIYFDYNKASLKKESTLSLNKVYDVLTLNPEMKITINAHTDSRGSDQYNLILSDKRAGAALEYLIKKGISKDRIVSKGYGETQLLSKCTGNCTDTEYEKDRRIEFLIAK